MKFFLSVLLFFVVMSGMAFAQTGILSTDLQKIQNTDNWEFNLQYNFNNPASNAIIIELPANFKVTPISINIDGQDMWLKNSAEVTENDSVVFWENSDKGLILRFSENLVRSAVKLNMKCLAQTGEKIENNTLISIKPMLDNNQMSDEVIGSNNLNIIR